MARLAAIKDGVVVNIIEAEQGFEMAGHVLVASDTAGPGDTYSNGVFSRPVAAPVVPAEVTDLQARLALIAAGKLSAIEAAVASADDATKAWYDRALSWRRDSEIIAALAPAVGLSASDIDGLFIAASKITH